MEADDEPPAGMLTRWGGGAHRGRVSLVEYGGSEIEVAEHLGAAGEDGRTWPEEEARVPLRLPSWSKRPSRSWLH